MDDFAWARTGSLFILSRRSCAWSRCASPRASAGDRSVISTTPWTSAMLRIFRGSPSHASGWEPSIKTSFLAPVLRVTWDAKRIIQGGPFAGQAGRGGVRLIIEKKIHKYPVFYLLF